MSVQLPNISLVTACYDLQRDQLKDFGRPYSFYVDNLCNLLTLRDYNFIVFTDKKTKELIKEKINTGKNVVFVEKEIETIYKNNSEIFDRIEKIRTNKEWYNQKDWLAKSPQAQLKYYNPLVLSKLFLLHDSKILNFFNSDFFFWIDCGINSTVSNEYLNNNVKLLPNLINDNKFLFLAFPYEADGEIHGFKKEELDSYTDGDEVAHVCRGGFFGGHKDVISKVNSEYYDLLNNITFEVKTFGTEECIFSLLPHLNEDLYLVAEIGADGLIYKFFKDLEEDKVNFVMGKRGDLRQIIKNNKKTALYILTFNCPEQLKAVAYSIFENDDFYKNSELFIIDNSEDDNYSKQNKEIADKLKFNYIKLPYNYGVCGGRQFVAEHFDREGFDYYIFFEDDMILNLSPKGDVDKFGFQKHCDDLYFQIHEILEKEGLDFLKLNFTEFYGDCSKGWHFLNISKEMREKYYPNRKKNVNNLPPTKFTKIAKNGEFGLTYALGDDIFYSNWPILFSKSGNKKLFLDKKLEKPYEQMWMGRNFELQMKEEMKSGVLLSSPISHERNIFYEGKLRREN